MWRRRAPVRPRRAVVAMRVAACVAAGMAGWAAGGAARAGEVEVLHFWTSPGEARSIDELKALIAERGHTWKDFAVVGGGGGNAMQALKVRVAAGSPPAAASMKGPEIQEWAAQGLLTNLDAMAAFDHWDDVLPPTVQDLVKYKGHYVAVPVNVHRVNWLWGNRSALARAGVAAMPATWADFFVAADKLRAARILPVAIGQEPWQEFTLFDSVALGVGGADFYRRALVDLDADALASPTMQQVLLTFRRVKSYTDPAGPRLAWNQATDLVIKGGAAFQFMGDWAKGEFTTAGRTPGKDYDCARVPGTAGAFTYVVDTFAMFQLRNWEAQRAQGYLAYVLLGQRFQHDFNLRKGSIPVRGGIALDDFDSCARMSRADFLADQKDHGLLPSVAIDMALPSDAHGAFQAIVSRFWEDGAMTPEEAMHRLQALSPHRLARR